MMTETPQALFVDHSDCDEHNPFKRMKWYIPEFDRKVLMVSFSEQSTSASTATDASTPAATSRPTLLTTVTEAETVFRDKLFSISERLTVLKDEIKAIL